MKILTFNVRQWSRDLNKNKDGYWKDRAEEIRKLIEQKDPDVILFQEMTFPMTRYIPDGYKRVTCLSISHHIYCKKDYIVKSHEWHIHWCRVCITKKGQNILDADHFNIFSVHSHWDEKIYKRVAEQIKSFNYSSNSYINIAGGDWNVFPNVMEPLLSPYKLVKTGKVTFTNWEKSEQFGELDYFAINSLNDLKKKYDVNIEMIDTKPFTSDHNPVMLELKLKNK